MAEVEPPFLGRGWAFPPRFTLGPGLDGRAAGEVEMVEAEKDIRESLNILLSTRRGERIVRPGFGLGLDKHVYDRMDDTSLGDLRSEIADAILAWEPRIKVEEIAFDESGALDGLLSIQVTYWIPSVNSRSNVVYPFYFLEGTSIVPPGLEGPPR